ncbi:putative ATP synthase F0, A subunit [Onchocerca flexuosa]|uniref:Putative ATP synthase F0, A subunit n=1 Tax=Onchocerca flexuosa TaxID=387005 RepID=A0A238BNC7_9BILA|nr:putative ATP synthase F0, A subunit [Onchocerca flexuosa]
MSKLLTSPSTSQQLSSSCKVDLAENNNDNECSETYEELPLSTNDSVTTKNPGISFCLLVLINLKFLGSKAAELLAFCQQITLRRIFRLIGYSIGSYPLAYVIAAVIMSIMSFGIYYLKLEDRVRDGYTPTTAPSRHEADLLRQFTNSFVILQARDGGSMHRLKYLKEAVRLHRYFMNNFTVEVPSTGERILYKDLCGLSCDANIVIEYFYNALLEEYEKEKMGKARSETTNLTYPIAKLFGFDVHLERNFYGVRLHSSTNKQNRSSISEGKRTIPEETIMQAITNIEYVQVIFMIFQGQVSSPSMETKLNAWEVALYKYATQTYTNEPIKILVLGPEIVNQELIKDSQRMAPYFVAGFLAMFLVVAISLIISALILGVIHPAKLIVAFGVIACPILAITVTFGLFALAQLRTNTIMLIMPFLVMGIGVNGAFMVIHSWLRSAGECSVAQRLGFVLEEAGPSVTISTFTNVITFGIGALTPTPEIALFCFETAIALAFAYIFTLVLLCPLLYLATILERTRKKNSGFPMIISGLNFILKFYCRVITSKLFGFLAFIGILVYWFFGFIGALTIETRLDVEKLLPKNSPLQEANAIISSKVWTEYYPVMVLINSPLDIRNEEIVKRFDAMVNEFEALEKCRGKEFTLLWLRDYRTYWNEAELYDFDYFADDVTTTTALTLSDQQTEYENQMIDYSKLNDFLFSPNLTSWKERIELMQKWRHIANAYKDLNASVWEANSLFVDQMLSLKTLAWQTCIWTLICMTIVCGLFIQNPFSVIVASLTIASISFGVIGFLSWWHLDLDPATLCAILMCIGMSVDFTAHVSYHYQLGEKKTIKGTRIMKSRLENNKARLEYTLKSVAWPTLQGGISTVACIVPLAFLENYIPLVFVKTISLVVIWGLFHGLVLLPTFLSLIPHSLLEFNCYRAIFGKHLFSTTDAISSTYGSNHAVSIGNDADGSSDSRKKEDKTIHDKDDRNMSTTELRRLQLW